jgi:[acyl-carrier-protein] S-malonyltransferase
MMQIFISNMNLPPTNGDHGIYLISGERRAFMEVQKKIGGKVRDAKVHVPSHSPLVEHIESALSHKLDELMPHEKHIALDYPVFSTMACAYLEKSHLKEKMKKHLSTPVNWIATVDSLLDQGARTFVEVGPGYGLLKTVSRMADNKGIGVATYTTSTKEELEKTLEELPIK